MGITGLLPSLGMYFSTSYGAGGSDSKKGVCVYIYIYYVMFKTYFKSVLKLGQMGKKLKIFCFNNIVC